MNVKRWLADAQEAIERDGLVAGARHSTREPWIKFLRVLEPGLARGENIAARDWDVCVVLDACRTDLFDEVAPPELRPVGTIRSLGSMTAEWMERTFVDGYDDVWSETTYVCANPHSEKTLDASRFAHVEEVWKYAWDDADGTVHPRPVTNAAIGAGRSGAERLLVHYMQPHYPFVGTKTQLGAGISRDAFGSDEDNDVWTLCSRGRLDRKRVWEAYRETLRYVLEDVMLLVENVDGRVAITSDHGNAVGEWGLYGHPRGAAISALRSVPWVTIDATDDGTHEPTTRESHDDDVTSVEDQLRALGYR